MGVAPARTAWAWLIDHLGVDTVVAVDGGTDALLSGVESGLGTPAEDVTTMLGVYAAAGPVRKLLVCDGFGVDAHHGVAHAEVLEAIAALDAAGGYWGGLSLTRRSPEVRDYLEAVDAAHADSPGWESIVSASVAAAARGPFGNVQLLECIADSTLFINPLMAMYWTFDLAAVVERLRYAAAIGATTEAIETAMAIARWRGSLDTRPRPSIPL